MNKLMRRIGLWIVLPVLSVLGGKKTPAVAHETGPATLGPLANVRDTTPVYLEHARSLYGEGTSFKFAGHRSHSSHRSHYSSSGGGHISHVSHQSHYSAYGTGAPVQSAPPQRQPERSQPTVTKPKTEPKTPSPRSSLAEDYMKRGLSASRSGNYQDAINLYTTLLALEPINFMAHNNIGVAYYKKGDAAKATESLRKAIEINPNYADAHFNLGVVMQEQGQSTSAQVEFQKACDLGLSDACKMIKK